MATRKYEQKKFLLTNSMTGKREEFRPAHPPKVLFYSCGPTVYGALHIGNARALIFADLLYRWLLHIGYDVNFVRNYTDVDDKIINRANEEKIPPNEVSEKYIRICEQDIATLGLKMPTKVVKVTESMSEIISLIQKIIDRKHAYIVDGEVFFAIDSFKDYGKLSGKNVEDLQAGARVEVDTKKKSPMDFSLWKPAKPGEPFWESPWGKGRPGWHIECSAMASRWLADTIDLHHGGQDLIFPHHENEIAQSEAASGKPFCKHWVHHAFLTSGNEKMSKSLGNILTIKEFTDRFGAELLKFLYLSFNFRTQVPYTEATLTQCTNELERVYLAKRWAVSAANETVASQSAGGKTDGWAALSGRASDTFTKMEDELFSDLNTPGALGHLFTFIRDINRAETQAAPKPGFPAPQTVARQKVATEFLSLLDEKLFPLVAVFGRKPEDALNEIERIRKARSASAVLSDDEISAKIEERKQARVSKDFKKADEIRKELDAKGIILVDGPQGTTWKNKG